MSTLRNQLAALNQRGDDAPGVVVTTTRNTDAGWRPTLRQDVVLKTPTFVYETAAEAANVPLDTVERQVRDRALPVWHDLDPHAAHVVETAILKSPSAAKPAPTVFWTYLQTFLGIRDDTIQEACLWVLEYTVRCHWQKQTSLWQPLLWTCLLHHQQRPALLHRCGQLIFQARAETVATQPYIWLRPYCDDSNLDGTTVDRAAKRQKTSATSSGGRGAPAVVSRSLIAIKVIQDRHLLDHVCRMARDTAVMVAKRPHEVREGDDDALAAAAGHTISWTAAVIVQGLSWLDRQATFSMSVRRKYQENVLRVLVPFVTELLETTQGSSGTQMDPIRSWSFVVASAAAEAIDLSNPILEEWVAAMLGSKRRGEEEEEEICDKEDDNGDSQKDPLAWAAVASLLLPTADQGRSHHDDSVAAAPISLILDEEDDDGNGKEKEVAAYLPILASDPGWEKLGSDKWQQEWLLGCRSLTRDMYRALVGTSTSRAPIHLAHLYEDGWAVTPLLVGLWVRSVQYKDWAIAQALLEHPTLQTRGWGATLGDQQWDLVASAAAWLLHLPPPLAFKPSLFTKDGGPLRLFHILYRMKPSSMEHGWAHIFVQNQGKSATHEDRMNESKWMEILKRLVDDSSSVADEDDEIKNTSSLAQTLFLPPRLALAKSPSAEIRLEAVEALARASSTTENNATGGDKPVSDVFDVLLTQWSREQDWKVLKSIARVLGNWPQPHHSSLTHSQAASLIVQGWHSWLERITGGDGQVWLDSLNFLFVSETNMPQTEHVHVGLMEIAVLALSQKPNEEVRRKAASMVLSVLESRGVSLMDTDNDTGKDLSQLAWRALWQEQNFAHEHYENLKTLVHEASPSVQCQAVVQGCARGILSLVPDALRNERNPDLALYALRLSMQLAKVIPTSQHFAMVGALETAAELIAESSMSNICSVLVSFADLPTNAFDGVGRPLIRSTLESIAKKQAGKGGRFSIIAILMESALDGSASVGSSQRLIDEATKLVRNSDQNPKDGIVPALSLLQNHKLRPAITDFLRCCEGKSKILKQDGLGGLKSFFKEFRSTKGFSESMSLPDLLTRCLSGEKKAEIVRSLLTLFRQIVGLEGCIQTMDVLNSLPCTVKAVAEVVQATGVTGEDIFPLVERWNDFGSHLVKFILSISESTLLKNTGDLRYCVVSMLTGRTLAVPKKEISSGPNNKGGRTRSYSVSSLDDVCTLQKYPSSMSSAIVDILNSRTAGGHALAPEILRGLFLKGSWGSDVFVNLSSASRQKIADAWLRCLCDDQSEMIVGEFSSFPFCTEDLCGVLTACLDSENDASGHLIGTLSEVLRSKAEMIAESEHNQTLIGTLFMGFCQTEMQITKESAEDFFIATEGIVAALEELTKRVPLPESMQEKITECMPHILKIIEDREGTRLASVRCRILAYSLLATLAYNFPDEGLKVLLTASRDIVTDGTLQEVNGKRRSAILGRVVRVFWEKQTSSVTLSDLLLQLQNSARNFDAEEKTMQELAVSLFTEENLDVFESHFCYLPGAFVAIRCASNADGEVDRAVQIFENLPSTYQIPSLFAAFNYAKNLLIAHQEKDGKLVDRLEDGLPQHEMIASIACAAEGSGVQGDLEHSNGDQRGVLTCASSLLTVVRNSLVLASVRRQLKSGTGEAASKCLALWQGMLFLEAFLKPGKQAKSIFPQWTVIESRLEEVKSAVHSIMPAHLFLASVTSMLQEKGNFEMRAKLLVLFAERALDLDPLGHEASLFCDLIPEITDMLLERTWTNEVVLIGQCALMALEHLGRALATDQREGDRAAVFVPVVKVLSQAFASVFKEFEVSNTSFEHLTSSIRSLLSNLALSCGTIIRIAGPKSLEELPSVLTSLCLVLSCANTYTEKTTLSAESSKEARDMQLAALRGLSAIAESVPHFLKSQLHVVLSESTFLSESLHSSNDRDLSLGISNLQEQLPLRIAPRLFIDALSKIIEMPPKSEGFMIVLPMLRKSVERLSTREAGAFKSKVFQCVTSALGCVGKLQSRKEVVDQAAEVLMSLVLKLSETNLLRLYSALHAWKTEEETTLCEASANRRLAFWTISATLVSRLKSLSFPCVEMVLADVKDELEHAQTLYSRRGQGTAASAPVTKKRKVSDYSLVRPYESSIMILQAIFLMLESALRSDARDGGNWIRAENGKRYHVMLDSLSPLFFATIESNSSPLDYLSIIEASETQSGDLVSTLTALALSAGDEQLWKPLNHAVLEACGSETRREVRSAGLACLLALIRTLGEEYMVLLPECLPVLGELLEDSNDDISARARDAIALSEELIGESLEETLK